MKPSQFHYWYQSISDWIRLLKLLWTGTNIAESQNKKPLRLLLLAHNTYRPMSFTFHN